uniref:Kazal-like domain-containing protein n=1 Tax=Ciona savignyi TaxID=51511 RepID=H2YKG7_CIOSA
MSENSSIRAVCTRRRRYNVLLKSAGINWMKVVSVVFALHVTVANATTFCDPDDAATCRFGGKCTSVSTMPVMLSHGYRANDYVCMCPNMQCNMMRYDPICASDGRTYVNDLCRELQECEIQAPLNRVCNGFCGRQCN